MFELSGIDARFAALGGVWVHKLQESLRHLRNDADQLDESWVGEFVDGFAWNAPCYRCRA